MTAPSLVSWEVEYFHKIYPKVSILCAVWLLVGTIGIFPIFSNVIKKNIGLDLPNVVNTVANTISETGIGEIPSAAPSVRYL